MPWKAGHLCGHRGCPEVVPPGVRYCEEHAPVYAEAERVRVRRWKRSAAGRAASRRYDAGRGSPAERGYDERWRKVRRRYLSRHPLCEDPLRLHHRAGVIVASSVVHHIVAIADGGRRLAPRNLQALCAGCHARVENRVRKEMG